jgi:hypothetical protein
MATVQTEIFMTRFQINLVLARIKSVHDALDKLIATPVLKQENELQEKIAELRVLRKNLNSIRTYLEKQAS